LHPSACMNSGAPHARLLAQDSAGFALGPGGTTTTGSEAAGAALLGGGITMPWRPTGLGGLMTAGALATGGTEVGGGKDGGGG